MILSTNINDEYIINNFFSRNGKINKYRLNNASIEELYYLNNRYEYFDSLKEVLFRIYRNIEIRPICKICGKPVIFWGTTRNIFSQTCSSDCSKILNKQHRILTNIKKYGCDNPAKSSVVQKKISNTKQQEDKQEIAKKRKETNLIRYGVENCFQSNIKKKKSKQTKLKRYGDAYYCNLEKNKQTCLERYGVEYITQTELHKKKSKQTKLKKYGDENYNNIEKAKQTCLERYGETSHMKTKHYQDMFSKLISSLQVQNKINNTKRKNNSFNKSQPEDECYNILKEKYPDITRQYRDERYPFNCDFYIPSLDLFIECNFHWTHGGKPFEGTDEDLQLLQYWCDKNTPYYNIAVKTWTIGDVNKRNIAKENNLNYIELWNLNDIYTILY